MKNKAAKDISLLNSFEQGNLRWMLLSRLLTRRAESRPSTTSSRKCLQFRQMDKYAYNNKGSGMIPMIDSRSRLSPRVSDRASY